MYGRKKKREGTARWIEQHSGPTIVSSIQAVGRLEEAGWNTGAASKSSTYKNYVMGSRVVERLRESGVEVSRANEILVCDHFKSLPKRYAVSVKDALSEILMHISLLEDTRNRSGQIAHCLRAVVANLPTKDPGRDVTNNGGVSYVPIPDDNKALNSHRIVSATPVGSLADLSSPLRSPSTGSFGSHGSLSDYYKESAASSAAAAIAMQDCYELTVAMPCSPASLAVVYTTIAGTGLSVAETHGFTTNDGYYLYWFVLQDQGRVCSEHLAALDNLLHARFSLDMRGAPGGHPGAAAAGGAQRSGGQRPQAFGAQAGSRRRSKSEEGGPRSGQEKGGGRPSSAESSDANQEQEEPCEAKGSGMRRGSSFLNLWKAKLDVQQTSVAEWEVDPDDLLLSKKVGQGAFGSIHKGTFKGEVVAIKYIKSDFNKEFEYIKEFAQEISIISELKHENIVKFIGACTKGERVCIIYEYMANGNLKGFLQKNQKLTTKEKLRMALDICKGMIYLSSKSIVHRDLKCANILITESGVVKIGDFGVARLLPRNEDCMTAETGTYRWMAPEVIEHKPYGTKADVYSFGVLLWELVSGGKSPYELLSPIQAAIGVAKHGVRPKIPPNCDPEVAAIMEACWVPEPEKRPAFEDIQVMLDGALASSAKSEAARAVASNNGGQKNSFTGLLSRILK